MVRVAFWFDAPVDYAGGLNYIKNLLYAVSLVNDGSVRPYVFFARDIPAAVEAEFAPYSTVVRTKLLQRGTLPWFVHQVLKRLFGSMALATKLLKAHGITVLSHAWFPYEGPVPFRIISWIPDFQYLHLPEFFPTLDREEETRQNRRIIAQSEAVVLSSNNALEDFQSIAPPGYECRGRVLRFVSQPRAGAPGHANSRVAIEKKYGFQGRFFFLPNQFWIHKNHMVVLRAVKLLKDRGIDVLVVCTGNVKDYRYKDTSYIDGIYAFIKENALEDHVKILGFVDYDDVLSMMRNSVAVLNPSRFEGWSSSVEEAKSIGKGVILSRIDVHLEQNPQHARYFDPDDADGLAQLLAEAWSAPDDGSTEIAEQAARASLHERTVEYGRAYVALLHSVAGPRP